MHVGKSTMLPSLPVPLVQLIGVIELWSKILKFYCKAIYFLVFMNIYTFSKHHYTTKNMQDFMGKWRNRVCLDWSNCHVVGWKNKTRSTSIFVGVEAVRFCPYPKPNNSLISVVANVSCLIVVTWLKLSNKWIILICTFAKARTWKKVKTFDKKGIETCTCSGILRTYCRLHYLSYRADLRQAKRK